MESRERDSKAETGTSTPQLRRLLSDPDDAQGTHKEDSAVPCPDKAEDLWRSQDYEDTVHLPAIIEDAAEPDCDGAAEFSRRRGRQPVPKLPKLFLQSPPSYSRVSCCRQSWRFRERSTATLKKRFSCHRWWPHKHKGNFRDVGLSQKQLECFPKKTRFEIEKITEANQHLQKMNVDKFRPVEHHTISILPSYPVQRESDVMEHPFALARQKSTHFQLALRHGSMSPPKPRGEHEWTGKDELEYRIYDQLVYHLCRRRSFIVISRWQKAKRLLNVIRRFCKLLAIKSLEKGAHLVTFTDIGDQALVEKDEKKEFSVLDADFARKPKDSIELKLSTKIQALMTHHPESRTKDEVTLILCELQCYPSFCVYPLGIQREIARCGMFMPVGKRRVIIRQGHNAQNWYFVVTGQAVETESTIVEGNTIQNTVKFLTAGMTIGEEAIVSDTPHAVTVTTRRNMQLIRMDKEAFYEVFRDVYLNMQDIQGHITYIKTIPFMAHFPIELILRHPTMCFQRYSRPNTVLVKDSTDSEWIVVVRSGQCDMLMYIGRTRASWRDLELALAHPKINIDGKPLPRTDTGPGRLPRRKKEHALFQRMSAQDINASDLDQVPALHMTQEGSRNVHHGLHLLGRGHKIRCPWPLDYMNAINRTAFPVISRQNFPLEPRLSSSTPVRQLKRSTLGSLGCLLEAKTPLRSRLISKNRNLNRNHNLNGSDKDERDEGKPTDFLDAMARILQSDSSSEDHSDVRVVSEADADDEAPGRITAGAKTSRARRMRSPKRSVWSKSAEADFTTSGLMPWKPFFLTADEENLADGDTRVRAEMAGDSKTDPSSSFDETPRRTRRTRRPSRLSPSTRFANFNANMSDTQTGEESATTIQTASAVPASTRDKSAQNRDNEPQIGPSLECGQAKVPLKVLRSAFYRRKQYAVPKACQPPAPSRDWENMRSPYVCTSPPVYVQIDTLTEGDCFGLDQLKEPGWESREQSGKMALISNGAEVVMLNKRFFMSLADDKTHVALRENMHIYPTTEAVQTRYRMQLAWQLYSQKIQDELRTDLRNQGRKYMGTFFRMYPSDVKTGSKPDSELL